MYPQGEIRRCQYDSILKIHAAFEPEAIESLSQALEEACKALHINGQIHDREVIAARIIDLARNGEIDAEALSERVIAETLAMRHCKKCGCWSLLMTYGPF